MKITVSNSLSYLETGGFVPWIKSFYEELSYLDQDATYAYKKKTGRYKEFRVYMVKKLKDGRHQFPTGLIDRVKFWFEVLEMPLEIEDKRVEPNDPIYITRCTKLPPLRDYQVRMLQAAMDNPRGIIESATGTGKTRMMIELVDQKRHGTLVVVPSLNILTQTYEQFSNLYSPSIVGMIGGGKEQLKKKVVVATYQSLLEKDQSFFDQFQQLLVDEAHHAAARTIQELNEKYFNHMYYRYYFTATPFRNDGADMAMEGVISNKKIFTYGFKEAVKDKWLAPPVFLIYPYEHKGGFGNDNSYYSEYKHSISENLTYNERVAEVAQELLKTGRHIIIFVKHVVHGELLQGMIPGSVLLTGNENTEDSTRILREFEEKKFNVLIGTSVIGEGVDMKAVDCGIIAGAGKSRGDIIQKIGRLLRPYEGKEYVMIVDFSHDGAKYAKKHFKEREKVYQTYGTKMFYVE